MPPRIDLEEDHGELVDGGMVPSAESARPGTPEGDEFERLAAMIGDYETRYGLGRQTGPGQHPLLHRF